jgi:ribonuclease HI
MPHFLLFAETGPDAVKLETGREVGGNADRRLESARWGAWRFVLRSADGATYFEAADVETDVVGERLDLLTLIRALESLDQSSRVSLIGCSSYIRQGIQFGMPEWRMNDWMWEWFGQMVPVKNGDLWQRLERLMSFHEVECRVRRIDGAHPVAATPNYLAPRAAGASHLRAVARAIGSKAWSRLPRAFRDRLGACERRLRYLASGAARAMQTLREHFVISVAELREPA